MEIDMEKRHRTLITLWFALFVSIGLYFLMTLFMTPQISRDKPVSSVVIVGLTALGTFLVVVSFPVKRKFLERSVENQDVILVQKGLVIACAMCEASALLGLLEFFVIGTREYYLLFLVAAVGTALHFPRRDHLLAASYKNPDAGVTWR